MTHLGTAPPHRRLQSPGHSDSLGQCGCGSCSKGPFSEADLCPSWGWSSGSPAPALPCLSSPPICVVDPWIGALLCCIRHVAILRLGLLVCRVGGTYSCPKLSWANHLPLIHPACPRVAFLQIFSILSTPQSPVHVLLAPSRLFLTLGGVNLLPSRY